MKCSKILSPMTGEAVGLGEVPDPVFSQKIVGDGMAVIPSEGKLLSPVDGEIISVADTKHAYGLRTAEGLELLIHVGLETVHLNGECFQVFVKPGDKVKAGDLLAEVDLAYLKERGINPITPVLVCGGFQGQQLNAAAGPVQAGKTVLMELSEVTEATADNTEKAAVGADGKPDKKPHLNFNFDFLQKLGKVLMTVIAVMPAAGLMISL